MRFFTVCLWVFSAFSAAIASPLPPGFQWSYSESHSITLIRNIDPFAFQLDAVVDTASYDVFTQAQHEAPPVACEPNPFDVQLTVEIGDHVPQEEYLRLEIETQVRDHHASLPAEHEGKCTTVATVGEFLMYQNVDKVDVVIVVHYQSGYPSDGDPDSELMTQVGGSCANYSVYLSLSLPLESANYLA